MSKKDLINALDEIIKSHPDLGIKYKKKSNVAELEYILKDAQAKVLALDDHSARDQNANGIKDDLTQETKIEIPEESVAHFQDEEHPEYCGTFGRINLDSPACKECESIMPHRNNLCAAVSVQAAEKKEVAKQSRKRAGGNGNRKRSEYKDFIAGMIAEGGNTRQAIIDAFVDSFPEAAKSTVTTYLSDGPNPKYCAFAFLLAIDKKSKVVSYTKTPAVGRAAFAKAAG